MRVMRTLFVWLTLNLILFTLLLLAVSLSEWHVMFSVTAWNMVKLSVFRPDGNFYLIGYDKGWQWRLVDVNLCIPVEE